MLCERELRKLQFKFNQLEDWEFQLIIYVVSKYMVPKIILKFEPKRLASNLREFSLRYSITISES